MCECGRRVDSRHEVCQTLADLMCPNEPEMATKVAEVLEDKFGPAEYETMEVAHAE